VRSGAGLEGDCGGGGCFFLAAASSATRLATSARASGASYAAHFYDMYINKHDGKHMTGDRMKILLLNLPFLLRDLVAPEVRLYIVYDITPDIMSNIGSDVIPYIDPMSYTISLLTSDQIFSTTPPDVPLALTDQVDQCSHRRG
jgi:hypothetical protein